MRTLFAVLPLVALTAGCAASTPQDGDEDPMAAEDALSSTSGYVQVRPDYRRCMSPMCGGWFVSRVNFPTIKCADGKWASECYVADIDWSKSGLPASTTDALSPSLLVIRGSVVTKDWGTIGKFGQLRATEAWQNGTDATATGTFYRLSDNGIRCFRAPCFSIDADKLNSTVSTHLSSLDGDNGGKASAFLSEKVIVAGTVHATTDSGKALAVSQFWTRVVAKTDPLACSVDADCIVTPYTKAVASSSECYCAMCPTAVMNTTTADANAASWTKYCSAMGLTCPMVKCIAPPPVACVAGTCTAS